MELALLVGQIVVLQNLLPHLGRSSQRRPLEVVGVVDLLVGVENAAPRRHQNAKQKQNNKKGGSGAGGGGSKVSAVVGQALV